MQNNTVLLPAALFCLSSTMPLLALRLSLNQVKYLAMFSTVFSVCGYRGVFSISFLHLQQPTLVTIMCSVTLLSVLMAGQIEEACAS